MVLATLQRPRFMLPTSKAAAEHALIYKGRLRVRIYKYPTAVETARSKRTLPAKSVIYVSRES